jgi:hypothetical protein
MLEGLAGEEARNYPPRATFDISQRSRRKVPQSRLQLSDARVGIIREPPERPESIMTVAKGRVRLCAEECVDRRLDPTDEGLEGLC